MNKLLDFRWVDEKWLTHLIVALNVEHR
jgi:hypothetical protein